MFLYKKWVTYVPYFIIVVVGVIGTYYRVNLDLWNDELYTLDKFTLVPLQTILYDYHVPNNHILFNLINKAFLAVLDFGSMSQLLNNPWVLRSISGVYSMVTIVSVFYIAKIKWGPWVAVLAVVFLMTSWPFMNYAFQIRGYALSSCLLSLLVLVLFRLNDGEFSVRGLFAVSALSFLLVVSIPLNLYVLLVLGMYFGGCIAIRCYKSKQLIFSLRDADVVGTMGILIGTLVALVFYIPIFNDVFFNEYTVGVHMFHHHSIEVLFHFVIQFLSDKWILLLVLLFGSCVLGLRKLKGDQKRSVILLLLLCFGPFAISFVRGDWSPSRSFIPLLPYFSLLLALCTLAILKKLKVQNGMMEQLVALLSLYCGLVFVLGIEKSEQMSQYNLAMGKRKHDLNANFFQTDYRPIQEAKRLKKHNKQNSPVILESTEEFGFKYFLDEVQVGYITSSNTDSLLMAMDTDFYVVTRRPFQLTQKLNSQGHSSIEWVSEKLNFHTVLFVRRK
jgi:hypothetical protein